MMRWLWRVMAAFPFLNSRHHHSLALSVCAWAGRAFSFVALIFLTSGCVSLKNHKQAVQAAYDRGFNDCDQECLALQKEIARYLIPRQTLLDDGVVLPGSEGEGPEEDSPWLK